MKDLAMAYITFDSGKKLKTFVPSEEVENMRKAFDYGYPFFVKIRSTTTLINFRKVSFMKVVE